MSEQRLEDAAKCSTPASHLSRQEKIEFVIRWAIAHSDEELKNLIRRSDEMVHQQEL